MRPTLTIRLKWLGIFFFGRSHPALHAALAASQRVITAEQLELAGLSDRSLRGTESLTSPPARTCQLRGAAV